jgi:hypothetical protein
LYFNTTEQEVRVYTDGDVWEPIQELSGDQTVNSLTSNNDVVVKGNLEVQGTTITVDSATAQTIDLGDNDRIRLGDSDDLQVYHDGTDSYIANSTGTLKLSGNTDVTGNITVSGTVDGRDIAADGATLDTALQNVSEDTTPQLGGDLDTNGNDIKFGDNDKAVFGASDDLQIYHNGSKSFIKDTGTGALVLDTDGDSVRISHSDNAEEMARFTKNGSVLLKYDGADKLATTSSGVDVTGTLVSDGLTVDGDIAINDTTPTITITDTDGATTGFITATGSSVRFGSSTSDNCILYSNNLSRLNINSGGDISFYEDTGTTAKLTWDASAEELQFKDNVKAEFGDGGDLVIYHNGNHSFIQDSGTGDLRLSSSKVHIVNPANTESMLTANENGAVTLYYDNSAKLATTSTGIDVTGTVTADALTIDGYAQVRSVIPYYFLIETDSTDLNTGLRGADGQFQIRTFGDNLSTSTTRFALNHSSGDISFYDDAGTSQDFYWDASTSRLGIGTTSPSVDLEVNGTAQATNVIATANSQATNFQASASIKIEANNPQFHIVESDGPADENFNMRVSGGNFQIRKANDALNSFTNRLQIDGGTGDLVIFADDGTSQDFYWDASTSRLGLGTTSPAQRLHLDYGSNILTGSGEVAMKMTVLSSFVSAQNEIRSGVTSGTNPYMSFAVREASSPFATVERMRITQNGNVGIGTTSPSEVLELRGSTNAQIRMQPSATGESGFINTTSGSTKGMVQYNHNSNFMRIYTNGSEAMRIDSAGRLGIGTTTPQDKLNIIGDSLTGIQLGLSSDDYYSQLGSNGLTFNRNGTSFIQQKGSGELAFRMGSSATEAMRITSSGRLGIGTTNPSTFLHVKHNGGGLRLQGESSDLYGAYLDFAKEAGTRRGLFGYTGSGTSLTIQNDESGDIRFNNNGSEAARIDSSGNLLVGKTATASTTVGAEIRPEGRIFGTTDDVFCLLLNRTSTDGEIAQFRKDGSTVGSIGAYNGDTYWAGASRGFRMDGQFLLPTYTNGQNVDGASNGNDLGDSSARWRNLYLSGGVYLGGTGSANLLDDYEEGTWFPDVSHATGFSTATVTSKDGRYTKIGRQVTLEFEFSLDSSTGNIVAGDDVVLTSNCLPFIPSFNGHAVGTFGCQLNMSTGEDIAMAYAGFAGTNVLGFIFHTVDGTVGRSNIMGGVVTYFTDA